ncbi:MAG: hypothetical protein RBS84_05150 [Kiritimatiellia bacterium]|jgi:hypothetical protein|nr:hypothetical protein [Kiritimatiellia bacterium]
MDTNKISEGQPVRCGRAAVPSGIGSDKAKEEATDFALARRGGDFTDTKPIWKSGNREGMNSPMFSQYWEGEGGNHGWTRMGEGKEKRRGINLNSRTQEKITGKRNYEKREIHERSRIGNSQGVNYESHGCHE